MLMNNEIKSDKSLKAPLQAWLNIAAIKPKKKKYRNAGRDEAFKRMVVEEGIRLRNFSKAGRKFKVSQPTVHYWAKELGLHKDSTIPSKQVDTKKSKPEIFTRKIESANGGAGLACQNIII